MARNWILIDLISTAPVYTWLSIGNTQTIISVREMVMGRDSQVAYLLCRMFSLSFSPRGEASMGGKGGRVPPKAKNCPKIRKKKREIWKKREKIRNKREISWKRGKIGKAKNQEDSFTLPLLTDRAGYTTVLPFPRLTIPPWETTKRKQSMDIMTHQWSRRKPHIVT